MGGPSVLRLPSHGCLQTLVLPQSGLVDPLNGQAAAMAIDDYLRQWSMDAHPLE